MTVVLSALDATFLELEQLQPGALMSIGGMMVFEPLPGGGAPTLGDVRTRLAARLVSLPRYMQRLSTTGGGELSWPHWVTDERFDIRQHVSHVALPAPGGASELCDLTAELFSHPLDRARPLWELVLVEGLEGGRWALAEKVHHCLVDGVGSVDMMRLLLDVDRDAGEETTEPVIVPLTPNGLRPPGADAIEQASHAGWRAAEAGLHAALHPRQMFERSRSLAQTIIRDEASGAPQTTLNVPIGQTRAFATVRIPLSELRQIGHQLDGSVNDAVLAVCTAGLRSLLVARRDALPARGLRAMVPVNVRDQTGQLAVGNRVSALFVELPVAEEDPAERLRAIIANTRRLKRSGGAVGASTLIGVAEVFPPVLVRAALARTAFSTRLFNLTITNVPGPQVPLYAFGAKLEQVLPVVPLAAEHAVGIAAFSYDGTVTFGINADARSVPDLDAVAYGIEEGVQELLLIAAEAVARERQPLGSR
jgi:diacylglycerol O-acyltransferase